MAIPFPAAIFPFHFTLKTVSTLASTPGLVVGAAEVAGGSIARAHKFCAIEGNIANIALVAIARCAIPGLAANAHPPTRAADSLSNYGES